MMVMLMMMMTVTATVMVMLMMLMVHIYSINVQIVHCVHLIFINLGHLSSATFRADFCFSLPAFPYRLLPPLPFQLHV